MESQHMSRPAFPKETFYVSGIAPNHNPHDNLFIPLVSIDLHLVCKLQGKQTQPHNMMLYNEAQVASRPTV